MTQEHIHDRIQDYVDGALSVEETRTVRNHIATCADCARELASVEALVGRIRQLPKERPLPAGFLEDADAALRTAMAHERRNGHAPAPIATARVFQFTTQFRWFAAAAAVVIAGLALLVWNPFRATGPSLADSGIRDGNTGKSSLAAEAAAPPSGTEQQTTVSDDRPAAGNAEELRYHAKAPAARANRSSGLIASRTDSRPANQSAAGGGLSQSESTSAGAGVSIAAAPPVGEDVVLNAEKKEEIGSGVSAKAKTASVSGMSVVAEKDSRDSHAGKRIRVSGSVVDEKGDALAGATVQVVGTMLGAVTDPAGKFTIIGVPAGTISLKVSMVGYQTVTLASVNTDTLTFLAMTLPMASVAMQEVVISADRPPKQQNITSSMQIARAPDMGAAGAGTNAETKSVNDVIKLQAGTMNSSVVRGGRADEIEYMVDGKRAATIAQKDVLDYRYHEFDKKRYEQGQDYRPPYPQNSEEYKNYVENGFQDATAVPLSTFSIDVDAASYTNIRRMLNDRQMPPADAVRIEEMINYFKYDYRQPKGDVPFSVNTDIAQCPWAPGHKLVLVGLQGKTFDADDLPPSNLTFLIDVSGSMNHPEKLPLVKEAFKLLVKQLRSQDRVAIVVYAGNAGLVLPSTPGNDRETIIAAINRLEAGGSTAGGAGIRLAYNVAKENFIAKGNNRVILATDGDFNVGVSSEQGLEDLITERRNDGIFLTVLGFGMGNIKDNKMQTLADKGNGNNYYIDNLQEARRVFIGQMAGTLFTIAKDVKIQIEFNPENVKSYRLIGYEKRILNKEDFNDDTKDAGELGAGHTVTALYEIVPAGSDDAAGVDPLKYQGQHENESYKSSGKEYRDELLTLKLRYKEPRGDKSRLITTTVKQGRVERIDRASVNLRFAAAVAEAGMLLKGSAYKGQASFDHARQLAESAEGSDDEGYRSEFIQLLNIAKSLYRDTDRYK